MKIEINIFRLGAVFGAFLFSTQAFSGSRILEKEYENLRGILYPGSAFAFRLESPILTTHPDFDNYIKMLRDRHGDGFLRSDEYMMEYMRAHLLVDLKDMMDQRSLAYQWPSSLSGFDFGQLVQQQEYKRILMLAINPNARMLDIYQDPSSLKWALRHLFFMMENSQLPLKFADLNEKNGFLYWLHLYVTDRQQLQMFYRLAMNKAATPRDLSIFVAGFIDVTREIEGKKFSAAWPARLQDEVIAVLAKHEKKMDWLMNEAYPELLRNAQKNEQASGVYVYGFRECLNSYLELTRLQEMVPRLSGLGSDADLKAAAPMVMTNLLNREMVSLPAWRKATLGVLEWIFPPGLDDEALRARFSHFKSLSGNDLKNEVATLVREVNQDDRDDAFAVRGALWNVPFQRSLQGFLSEQASKRVWNSEDFFVLTNYVSNQAALLHIYHDYIRSIQSEKELQEFSFNFYQRIGRDLGWAKFRRPDETPAFRENLPPLLEALWQKFDELQRIDVTKTDWIRRTWMDLLHRKKTRTKLHLVNFASAMLVYDPVSFLGVLMEYREAGPETGWWHLMRDHYQREENLVAEVDFLIQRGIQRAMECETLLIIGGPRN